MFPYNQIIKNGDNGIILSKKDDLIERIKFFSENINELKRMGENANKFVLENFSFTEKGVEILDEIYNVNYENEEDNVEYENEEDNVGIG